MVLPLLTLLLPLTSFAGGVGSLDVVTRVQPQNIAQAEKRWGQLELVSCAYDLTKRQLSFVVRNSGKQLFADEIIYMYGNPGVAIPPHTVAYDEGNIGQQQLTPGEAREFFGTPATGQYFDPPLSKGVPEPPALLMQARPDLCENVIFASLYNGAVWQYVEAPCAGVKAHEARVKDSWIKRCEVKETKRKEAEDIPPPKPMPPPPPPLPLPL